MQFPLPLYLAISLPLTCLTSYPGLKIKTSEMGKSCDLSKITQSTEKQEEESGVLSTGTTGLSFPWLPVFSSLSSGCVLPVGRAMLVHTMRACWRHTWACQVRLPRGSKSPPLSTKSIGVKDAYCLADALRTVVRQSHQSIHFPELWRETRYV